MFGMLDYRAHKLFWLVCLPIRLCVRLCFFANVAISIFIANTTSYSVIIKVIIGYLLFELIGMVLLAFWTFISLLIQRIFFWIVDIIAVQPDRAAASGA
jgi:hypothetical protein